MEWEDVTEETVSSTFGEEKVWKGFFSGFTEEKRSLKC